MITERTEILKRALEHYHFKLTQLAGIENYNPADQFLADDMSLNISKVSDAILLMGGCTTSDTSVQNVLCYAFINYISDLETSKKDVSEKLAGAKPSLDIVEKEIHSAKQVSTEVCNH